MECTNNSKVLEFDFTMGQFLKDFFCYNPGESTKSDNLILTLEEIEISDTNRYYLAYRTYKPPILEINYPNGNFDDEYKYIYIQCPKITNLLQNCFTNRITGDNTYVKYFQQSGGDVLKPVFKISDTNEAIINNVNWKDINNNYIMSLSDKLYMFDRGQNPNSFIQIITPTENNLISNLNAETNKPFYIPYNLRNKNKLYLQLDLNYNNFALLLNSCLFNIDFTNESWRTLDNINHSPLIRNFQFVKTSLTEFKIWWNTHSQQINVGEFLDLPIQIFIAKEAL